MSKATSTTVIAAILSMILGGVFRLMAGDCLSEDILKHREQLRQAALKNKGDAKRGSVLISRLECANCHDLHANKEIVGPSLKDVSDRLGREEIAAQLLDPSSRGKGHILVEFKNGRNQEFHLLKEEGDTLKVRDLKQKKELTLHKNELESFRPMMSGMPEGQVDHLTPEQFTDLVEFLVGNRTKK